jgi:hypothetical protein
MSKKLITTVAALVCACAYALPATATPSSPGACNMLHVSPTGMNGMGQASGRGLDNMMALVAASVAAGCGS